MSVYIANSPSLSQRGMSARYIHHLIDTMTWAAAQIEMLYLHGKADIVHCKGRPPTALTEPIRFDSNRHSCVLMSGLQLVGMNFCTNQAKDGLYLIAGYIHHLKHQ
ncbi:hypothetical protein FOQG_19111 [Fusarium oxysporum f. sp. raphani 54005]|uniref:Uncharacterized protein n=1 Tax=Fusarium oxysporum f. sp. raphani 54005 TaxID=1089458 RepID=X0BCA4_FUSOX|nr:hypothetical protein FOQG_19111 [Fusarium oxysporum f. sp. raphani 54005]